MSHRFPYCLPPHSYVEHVADDSGRRRLELPQLLAVLRARNRLDITFQRAVEHYIAGGRQRAQTNTEKRSGFDQTILPTAGSHAMKLPMPP